MLRHSSCAGGCGDLGNSKEEMLLVGGRDRECVHLSLPCTVGDRERSETLSSWQES